MDLSILVSRVQKIFDGMKCNNQNRDSLHTIAAMDLHHLITEIVKDELNARYTNCTCQHRTMDIDDLGNEGFFS